MTLTLVKADHCSAFEPEKNGVNLVSEAVNRTPVRSGTLSCAIIPNTAPLSAPPPLKTRTIGNLSDNKVASSTSRGETSPKALEFKTKSEEEQASSGVLQFLTSLELPEKAVVNRQITRLVERVREAEKQLQTKKLDEEREVVLRLLETGRLDEAVKIYPHTSAVETSFRDQGVRLGSKSRRLLVNLERVFRGAVEDYDSWSEKLNSHLEASKFIGGLKNLNSFLGFVSPFQNMVGRLDDDNNVITRELLEAKKEAAYTHDAALIPLQKACADFKRALTVMVLNNELKAINSPHEPSPGPRSDCDMISFSPSYKINNNSTKNLLENDNVTEDNKSVSPASPVHFSASPFAAQTVGRASGAGVRASCGLGCGGFSDFSDGECDTSSMNELGISEERLPPVRYISAKQTPLFTRPEKAGKINFKSKNTRNIEQQNVNCNNVTDSRGVIHNPTSRIHNHSHNHFISEQVSPRATSSTINSPLSNSAFGVTDGRLQQNHFHQQRDSVMSTDRENSKAPMAFPSNNIYKQNFSNHNSNMSLNSFYQQNNSCIDENGDIRSASLSSPMIGDFVSPSLSRNVSFGTLSNQIKHNNSGTNINRIKSEDKLSDDIISNFFAKVKDRFIPKKMDPADKMESMVNGLRTRRDSKHPNPLRIEEDVHLKSMLGENHKLLVEMVRKEDEIYVRTSSDRLTEHALYDD